MDESTTGMKERDREMGRRKSSWMNLEDIEISVLISVHSHGCVIFCCVMCFSMFPNADAVVYTV